MASLLASARLFLAGLWSRLRAVLTQPRGRVSAIVAAILLLGLCVVLLALNLRAAPSDDPPIARAANQALAVTATLDATATNTIAATNTAKPRPTSKPVV